MGSERGSSAAAVSGFGIESPRPMDAVHQTKVKKKVKEEELGEKEGGLS